MFHKLGTLLVVLLYALADTDPATPVAGSIFNEQDLSGWVIEGTKEYQDAGETKPNWFVEDGAIHCAGHGFGFLRFDRKLSDFQLSLECSPGRSRIAIPQPAGMWNAYRTSPPRWVAPPGFPNRK